MLLLVFNMILLIFKSSFLFYMYGVLVCVPLACLVPKGTEEGGLELREATWVTYPVCLEEWPALWTEHLSSSVSPYLWSID